MWLGSRPSERTNQGRGSDRVGARSHAGLRGVNFASCLVDLTPHASRWLAKGKTSAPASQNDILESGAGPELHTTFVLFFFITNTGAAERATRPAMASRHKLEMESPMPSTTLPYFSPPPRPGRTKTQQRQTPRTNTTHIRKTT